MIKNRAFFARTLPGAALIAALLSTATSGAVPLAPGATEVQPAGMTYNDNSWLGGWAVIDEDRDIVCLSGAVLGKVQLRVVEESATPGYRDYYYRIKLNASSPYSVTGLSTSGFSGSSLNLDYRPDGLGTKAPGFVERASFASYDFVTPYSTAIAPGEESFFLFIHTTSTATPTADAVVYIGTTGPGSDVTCTITGAYRP